MLQMIRRPRYTVTDTLQTGVFGVDIQFTQKERGDYLNDVFFN